MSAVENQSPFPAWLEPQPHSPLARYVEAIRTTEPDEPAEDGRNLARMVIVTIFHEARKAKPGHEADAICAVVADRLGSDLTSDRVCRLIVAELQAAIRLPDPAMLKLRQVALDQLALTLRSVDLTIH